MYRGCGGVSIPLVHISCSMSLSPQHMHVWQWVHGCPFPSVGGEAIDPPFCKLALSNATEYHIFVFARVCACARVCMWVMCVKTHNRPRQKTE